MIARCREPPEREHVVLVTDDSAEFACRIPASESVASIHGAPECDDETADTEERELLDQREGHRRQIPQLMDDKFPELCEQEDVKRPEQLEVCWEQQGRADCADQVEQWNEPERATAM